MSSSVFVRGNLCHVDIPDDEKQTGTGAHGMGPSHIAVDDELCLDGRTLEEVHLEAQRICIGATFSTWKDFDKCIDSWGVIHHRSVCRYKTTPKVAIQKCRFAENVRSYSSKSGQSDGQELAMPEAESDLESDESNPYSDQENGTFELGTTEPYSGLTQCASGKENSSCTLTEEEVEDFNFEKSIRSLATSAKARQPLRALPVNHSGVSNKQNMINDNPQALSQTLEIHTRDIGPIVASRTHSKAPRSHKKHTLEWLPGRHSLLHPETGEKQKKKSCTGACGELTRFRPGREEDPDGFFTLEPCPWRVRAICRTRSGQIQITKCDLKHNCPQHCHKWRGPTSKSKWLGETLAPRVIRHSKGPVKELTLGFQQDYMRTTSYHQMWRAKDKVRDAYQGGQSKSFHCIPGLIQRLKDIDSNCVVDWEAMEDNRTFYRAFICPSATRKALAYCQPVVSLDACHTKNRKFPTQLFLATVLDGNMQILPLAYAVAPTENFDNWLWFLRRVDKAIFCIEEVVVPFMSDRCKGLIAAVKEVFPGKIHGMCAHHLRANVKTRFGKAAEGFFLHTMYANTKLMFGELLDRLEHSVAKGEAAAAYIKNLDPSLYARYAFPLPRFGKVTSNPCEATNSGLLGIREYAPFKLLVEMWYYMQKHFNESRQAACDCTETLMEPALVRYNANLKTFGKWQVFDDYGGHAKVQTTTGTEDYLVSLGDRPSCTCFELQEMVWPCEHVMAWDDQKAKSFHRHFHKCWRVASWRSLYAEIIPSFICNDIPVSNESWPPEVAIKKGRHGW